MRRQSNPFCIPIVVVERVWAACTLDSGFASCRGFGYILGLCCLVFVKMPSRKEPRCPREWTEIYEKPPSWAGVPVKDKLFNIWKAYLIPVTECTGEILFHLLRPSAERCGGSYRSPVANRGYAV